MNEPHKTFPEEEIYFIDRLLTDMYFERVLEDETAKSQLAQYHTDDLLFLLKEHVLSHRAPVDLYILSIPEIDFDKGLDTLVELLPQVNATVRFYISRTLGFYKRERVIRILVSALQDDDIDVRGQALLSLGMVADERVLPLLKTLVSDPQLIWTRDTLGSTAKTAIRSIEGHIEPAPEQRRAEAIRPALLKLLRRQRPTLRELEALGRDECIVGLKALLN